MFANSAFVVFGALRFNYDRNSVFIKICKLSLIRNKLSNLIGSNLQTKTLFLNEPYQE